MGKTPIIMKFVATVCIVGNSPFLRGDEFLRNKRFFIFWGGGGIISRASRFLINLGGRNVWQNSLKFGGVVHYDAVPFKWYQYNEQLI